MSGLSQYSADQFLNTRFRTQAMPTKLTSVYIGLFNGDPYAGGTELSNAVGNYGRVGVSVADASWNPPATDTTYRYISNAAAITFNAPTADWNSGNPVTHFGVFDASTGGNRLGSGQLPTARTIVNNDNPAQFPAGSLRVRIGAAG